MAVVTSTKHRDHKINKHALALKLSEPRLKVLSGVDMSLIQKVDVIYLKLSDGIYF